MKRTVVTLVALLVAASLAYADAPRVGVITGTVLDPNGEGLPGATVQLISERGIESTVSGADGGFRFAFIIPDNYKVRADLAGFQSAEGMIVVSAGGRADVDLQLSDVAGDEILVTGETPLINKFDVTGGGGVDAKEIDSIVTPQRNYMPLLRFFPGVTPAYTLDGQDVEGMTQYHQTYYIDGVDTSLARYGGHTNLRLPNVAIGQVQMRSSRMDAEFSRSMGAVTSAVVKSGTNDFHGDVSATFQNLDWNSQYEMFPEVDVPDETDIRWEAAIGGRIVRDKLWFFASAADQGMPSVRVMATGERVDDTIVNEPWIGKLDFRPSASHSLSVTVADSPLDMVYLAGAAEPNAAAGLKQGGDFATLRWSWAISDDWFLDTAAASQESYQELYPWGQYDEDPDGAPWSPAANNDITYLDLNSILFWNYIGVGRVGKSDHPRRQGNASLNWFGGNHDVKFGVDYQDTGWQDNSVSAPAILGYVYNRNLPGGFAVPLFRRVYTGTGDMGGAENKTETWGVFVRDRLTVGDHWTFNLGLRLDDQTHLNDVGTEIFQDTTVAPRLTGVYDVYGNSKLLLTAGAARYYDWIPMELATPFNETPSGRNEYDQYVWVAALRNFVFQRHVQVASNIASNTIKPSEKNEFTLGAEWQLNPKWALKVNALYYEARDQYSQEAQIVEENGVDTIANVFENLDDAKLDRSSLSFVIRRRFRDGWTMTASYTGSRTEGNCYNTRNSFCALGYGEYRAITNEDGVPLSEVNRDGRPPNDLTHSLKVRGSYLFQLGRGHSINLSGFAWHQSGSTWNLIQNVTVPAPVDPPTNVTITEFLEPFGARRIPSTYQINLSGSWRFPIAGRFSGTVLIEALNVTDQQALTSVPNAGRISGDPWDSVANYNIQSPREYRVLLTLSF